MSTTAMTFNLRVHVPEDGCNAWPHRKHHVAAIIKNSAPDFCGTQEATNAMLQELDKALPDYHRIGKGRSVEGYHLHDETCAIYYNHTKLSLVEHGQFWLSETPDMPGSMSWDSCLPRICTWGLFHSKKGDGLKFYVLNTHFDHMGSIARQQSARLVLEKIQNLQEEQHIPVIMMGDLNAGPDEPEIVLLRQHLQDAYSLLSESPGCTFHDFKGRTDGEPIDYIFTTHDIEPNETLVHRDQLDGAYPSDHYPISLTWNLASKK